MECGSECVCGVGGAMRPARVHGDDLFWDTGTYAEKRCGFLSLICGGGMIL